MKTDPDTISKSVPKTGLSNLASVTLDARHAEHFREGEATCRGGAPWRQRKLAEFHDFLALSQQSGRINPMFANLDGPLKLLLGLIKGASA